MCFCTLEPNKTFRLSTLSTALNVKIMWRLSVENTHLAWMSNYVSNKQKLITIVGSVHLPHKR